MFIPKQVTKVEEHLKTESEIEVLRGELNFLKKENRSNKSLIEKKSEELIKSEETKKKLDKKVVII